MVSEVTDNDFKVLVQFPINGCSFWQNDFSGFYAARTSAQSARTVTGFLVSSLRLNWFFLIFSANSMPRIVTAAVSNRLNPSIGSDSLLYPAMILLDHAVQILAGSHPYAAR